MKRYMKYFNLEIMIDNYLGDIEGYTESAYRYILEQPNDMDKNELLMYLSSVPESIKTIKELIDVLAETYEKEIRGEKDEFDE